MLLARFLRSLIPLGCALSLIHAQAQGLQECTAAVISPGAAEGGRAMLWKNRDTAELSNRVVFVKEQPYSYLGGVDKDNHSGRSCWAGIKAAGFATHDTTP